MQYDFKSISKVVVSYLQLDILTWVLIGLGVALNLVLWYIWMQIEFNIFAMGLVTGILILNIILTILFDNRGQIISYSLMGTAVLCQILIMVLLYNSIYI